MPQLAVRSFRTDHQPFMARQAYANELRSAFTFSWVIALLESSVIGILARRVFDVPPFLFAILMAAQTFSFLTSILWARVGRGRRKIPFIVALMSGAALAGASIGVLPSGHTGGVALVCVVIVARCLFAGVVTNRSTVWRLNYPRASRAQSTGRLAIVSVMIIAIVPALGYRLLDYNPQIFRILYPVAALVSVIGIWSYSRIKLRRERELLEFELGPDRKPTPHGMPSPLYEYDQEQTRPGFWSVLRSDIFFRKYMVCQFLVGMSNLAIQAVAVYIIADMTRDLRNGYFISVGLTTSVPFLMVAVTLPLWTRYLDRNHIVTYRSRHVFIFLVEHALLFIAIFLGNLWILLASRVVQGVARGGATMAWQLGHNDFASRHMTAVYMGIHVTLTGVRGMIAPFLGILLYAGWAPLTGPGGTPILPGFSGVGVAAFPLLSVLTLISGIGFIMLNRQLKTEPRPLPE